MLGRSRAGSSSLGTSQSISASQATVPDTYDIWSSMFETGDNDAEAFAKPEPQRDALIFLVDCSEHMFTEDEELDECKTPFEMALKCVITCIKDKVVSNENDVMSVVFYCTAQAKNNTNFPGIYVFQKLDTPDAGKIKALDELLHGRFPFGHADPHDPAQFHFSHALWTCSTLFQSCPAKTNTNRVFIFTTEDDPVQGEVDKRAQAIQRLHDMRDVGIELELFAMNGHERRFSVHKFFSEAIVLNLGDLDTQALLADISATNKYSTMLNQVRKKNFKKRQLCSLPFTISPGVDIWVSAYTAIRESTKSKHVWLDPETNEPVKPVSSWVCATTLDALRPGQILKAYEFGGTKILFEDAEAKKMKSIYPVGMALLGFKDRVKLKVDHNIDHCSFIFPDERSAKGSTTAFAALLRKMLERDVIAICRYVPRVSSVPRIVALLAQKEVMVDGVQMAPSGFYIIPLPFADEIRSTVVPDNALASEESVVLASNMIQHLCIKYEAQDFWNPSLQKHYKALEALALDTVDVEEEDDYLLPDPEGMEMFSEVISGYKDAVVPEGYAASAQPATKRKAKEFSGDWNELVTNDSNARKVTVAHIKAKLAELGLTPVKGVKAKIWAQLCEAMRGSGASSSAVKKPKVEVKKENKEDSY